MKRSILCEGKRNFDILPPGKSAWTAAFMVYARTATLRLRLGFPLVKKAAQRCTQPRQRSFGTLTPLILPSVPREYHFHPRTPVGSPFSPYQLMLTQLNRAG
jgi:hypothetical protein